MARHNRAELEASGHADGLEDAARISGCPGADPIGPKYPWSFFYMPTYAQQLEGIEPHGGCKQCKGEKNE